MPEVRPTARPADFPEVRWHGHWIAPDLPDFRPGMISFSSELPPADFGRTQYRTEFSLDAVPARVPARLTADSRYVLWVNGVEVGRGPIRSQPRRMRYDDYDLAPHLRVGINSIAVLVTYYGTANAFWQPAVASGVMGRDALLVFEARHGVDEWIVSDDSWRVCRSTAWSSAPHGGIDGVPVELVDAREIDPAWTGVGFDDSGWAAASIVKVTHQGGFAVSQPPTDPYGALLPRGIGALGGEIVIPTTVSAASAGASNAAGAQHGAGGSLGHPADRVFAALAAQGAAALYPADFPLTSPGAGATLVVVDFGRIVAGFVEFELDAPAGTLVELLYQELPFVPALGVVASAPRTGARYIARGTDDRFSGLEVNGLRYVSLLIHGAESDTTLTSLRMREYHYPIAGSAFFHSSDPELDRLYTAGVRTVAMNSFDSFTDCPTREQRAWVGDGVVHQMVQLTTNEDWRLTRNYLALGDSPRPDHMLPMSVVGEIEVNGGITIPDWALHWVHGVHNQYRHDGDLDTLLAVLPTAEKVLRWYLPYVGPSGVIEDVPEWNLVDWSSVFSTGTSSILTSLWARGLREFAELCEWVGNAASAAWARAFWETACEGFEQFWDESRGTYIDHIVGGVPQAPASQAAGATAIASGLAPRERWSRIIDAITDPATLVVRSWIGGDDGGYDMVKIEEQSRGIQRIDWDAATEVVLAEPFYSYVVHDAVAAAGRAAELPALLRRWSVFLHDGYDTFGECWGWGTPVHGWSSTPTRDLVWYVLGVTPAEPGYTRARIAPVAGALASVAGAVPTPHGLIQVSVTRSEVGTAVSIDSPVAILFVDAAGAETELPAGQHRLAL
jgi:alpha-L-rhamnosidase